MKSTEQICAQCGRALVAKGDGKAPYCARCGTAAEIETSGSAEDSGTKAEVTGAATEQLRRDLSGSDAELVATAESLGRSKPKVEFLRPAEGKGEIGRIGQYRVISVLGEGGMGLVFRAEDVLLKRPVALKVIKPEVLSRPGTKDRFIREAQSVARINHEHIIPIHQVGEDQSVLFLAMPLLRGETLERRLKRNPPLTMREILRIARETAEGLAAAHELGLVHRDIKPGNIWLEASKEDGTVFRRVKVLDFGLARVQDAEDRLTRSGTVLGTPAFMSPEQAAGEVVDARADLWSLGVVLYKMFSGKNPFARADMLSTLAAVAVDEPTPLHEVNPRIPKSVSNLVDRLLLKDVNLRIAKASDVAAELSRIERQLAPKSFLRRWIWPLVGGAAALTLITAALLYLFVFAEKGPPRAGTRVTPEEATKMEGLDITLEFPIKSFGKTKTGGWLMLNSKEDFNDEMNMTIAIQKGADRMADFGLDGEITGRVVSVRGIVSKFRNRPQIVISDPSELKHINK